MYVQRVSVHCLLSCVVCMSIYSSCRAQPAVPAELNYWNLTGELIGNRVLRERLKITPEQLTQLRKLHDAAPLGRRMNDKTMELASQGMPFLPDDAYLLLDESARLLLEPILDASQLAELRSAAILGECKYRWRIFSRAGVGRYLQLEDVEQAKAFNQTMADTHRKFMKRWPALSEPHALKVIEAMPEKSRRKFIQYIGNSLTPKFALNPELSYGDIPFPWAGSSVVGNLVRNPELMRSMKLSQQKKRELANLDQAVMGRMLGPKANPKMSPQEHLNHVDSQVLGDVQEILTDTELLVFGRYFGLHRFLADFDHPFQEPELVKFFELENELQQILEVAKAESIARQDKLDELDRELFREVLTSLPESSQRRMRGFVEAIGW